MTLTGPEGLSEFSNTCENALFVENPVEFHYPEGCTLTNWPVAEIKILNADFLKGLTGKGNIYALYTKASGNEESWVPVYVGQRKSKALRERITQHLITKHEKINSMLIPIKTAVSDGSKVAVSFIKIEPDSLRLYVEETIISRCKNKLPWNSHE